MDLNISRDPNGVKIEYWYYLPNGTRTQTGPKAIEIANPPASKLNRQQDTS